MVGTIYVKTYWNCRYIELCIVNRVTCVCNLWLAISFFLVDVVGMLGTLGASHSHIQETIFITILHFNQRVSITAGCQRSELPRSAYRIFKSYFRSSFKDGMNRYSVFFNGRIPFSAPPLLSTAFCVVIGCNTFCFLHLKNV